MQMVSKAARRYANAFLEMAVSQNTLEKIKDDILTIQSTIEGSKELKLFLRNPIIKKVTKLDALEAIFGNKVQDHTMSLIHILSEKGREDLLLDITKAFIAFYKIHHGIIDVDVRTAFDLTDDQIGKLQKALESSTNKKVEMDIAVDKDLIGGLTVRIDDTVYDGSVKYQLGKLKEKFTAATVE